MRNSFSEYPEPMPHVPPPLEPQAPRIQPPTVVVYERERWEYKILEPDTAGNQTVSERELNDLGRAGWELAAVVPASGAGARLIFKRLQR